MQFFDWQAEAKRRTWVLLWVYLGVLVLFVSCIYLGFAAIGLGAMQTDLGEISLEEDTSYQSDYGDPVRREAWKARNRTFGYASRPLRLFTEPSVHGFIYTAAAVSIFLALCAVYKSIMLGMGMSRFAYRMGGKTVSSDSSEFKERVLQNVTEEVAIAASCPAPLVFVLEGQRGLNAFAMGNPRRGALIAVTEGLLGALSRDELQAVVAHEMSHVVHGDSELNAKMLAMNHGLLVTHAIGKTVIEAMFRVNNRYDSVWSFRGGSSRKETGPNLLLPVALVLLIVGYIGLFFAGLVRLAVSRQREYLADAAAVQYTRNPGALASALKKIGGASLQGTVRHRDAESYSHFFFASPGTFSFWGLLSSHPPLTDRIKRLDPQFEGEFSGSDTVHPPLAELDPDTRAVMGFTQAGTESEGGEPKLSALEQHDKDFAAGFGAASLLLLHAAKAERGVTQAGAELSAAQLGRDILSAIPEHIRRESHEAHAAQAILFALVMADTRSRSEEQWTYLRKHDFDGVLRETRRYSEYLESAPLFVRLPLTEMAISSLEKMSAPQFRRFKSILRYLVKVDNHCSLYEFVLQRLIIDRMNLDTVHPSDTTMKTRASGTFEKTASSLCICLAALTTRSDDVREKRKRKTDWRDAALAGLTALGITSNRDVLAVTKPTYRELDTAISAAKTMSFNQRVRLFSALEQVVLQDKSVSVEEAELLHCVGLSLELSLSPEVFGAGS